MLLNLIFYLDGFICRCPKLCSFVQNYLLTIKLTRGV